MQFFPLYIRRSDGKLLINGRYGKKEPNEPTPDQLDSKPDANGISDFYRQIPAGEMKEIDWRRKLGGMLIRELGGKEHRGNYILAALPENYRLYEHVKCRASEIEGRTQKPTKTHAGGGNERQDAYLYGHPQGRKKRYRSPADFFPHLLWLATDEAGDPDNCSCKLCTPDELQIVTSNKISRQEPVVRAEQFQRTGKSPSVVIPRTASAQDISKAPNKPPSVPTSNQRPSSATGHREMYPTRLPQPRSHEQVSDIQYAMFLFRPGEVVWFSRGQAWGLGAVLKRYMLKDSQGHDLPRYNVQPLSHPFDHPQIVETTQDLLRPWLAWSAPQCTTQFLNTGNFTYDTVDWEGVVTKRYGAGDPEVDASILAAKAVDACYTPFDPLPSAPYSHPSEPSPTDAHYTGIFLGGEKLWVGEPVRLRPGTGTDIMVLHDILERARPNPATSPTCLLIGDVYTFVTAPHTPQQSPTPDLHLPARLRDDLRHRNSISSTARGTCSHWRLLHARASLPLAEIKGRWYSSAQLLPVLRGDAFAQELARGEINDAGLWMNGRGDCSTGLGGGNTAGAGVTLVRKRDRKTAFGRSVPGDMRISRGLDDAREGVEMHAATAAAAQAASAQAAADANVDPALLGQGQGREEGQEQEQEMEEEMEMQEETEMQGVESAQGDIDQFMNLDGGEHNEGYGGLDGGQEGFYRRA